MSGGFIIGLTDRERKMHAENIEKMAESLLILSDSLKDASKDTETLIALMVLGSQSENMVYLMKAIQETTVISDTPDDTSGAET